MTFKTIITPEITAIILESIDSALPYEAAAWRAGICEKTLYNWINQGKADKEAGVDSEHFKLLQAIKKIEGSRMQALCGNVMNGVDRLAIKWNKAWKVWELWNVYGEVITFTQFKQLLAYKKGNRI